MPGWVVIVIIAADSWLAVRTALSGRPRRGGDDPEVDYAANRQQANAFHFGG